MPVFIDQTGRNVVIENNPKRIISVVPSQTELLFDLGLGNEVVGITKFCIHPAEWFISKNRVGGTKQLNMETIHSLQPDLIIANKEENVKEQIEELEKKYPVWVSDINNLDDALTMIDQIGKITDQLPAAADMVLKIKRKFNPLPIIVDKPGAAYLIWQNPYMSVGGDTFIHSLLEMAGFTNVFANRKRYPAISIEEIASSNCEWVLLSTEPFPFSQKHIYEIQALLPGKKIELVDGEMFSWYGSRLLQTPDYFMNLQKRLNK